ncbi:MAG: hypothetical protein ACTSPS_15260 [Promethearchaeota archaeon]
MDIEKLIGQKITILGIAKDAKGGAVILTPEKVPIYIKGLDSWSPELYDKQLEVTGVLKEEKFIPDPEIAEDGSISTGAYGDQLVLKDAEFFECE